MKYLFMFICYLLGLLGQQVPILDIYLLLEARRMKMNIASLESVDSYCEVEFF
jgi:hypothetical protein